jgi:low affinity Fe/Cu permease
MSALFRRFAKSASWATGHPISFVIAVLIVVVWGLTGPLFEFGNTWQLVINTGTTIITFLMVFLIQSSQNRDTIAIQIKLDELIRATEGAHNRLLDLEELGERELEEIRGRYEHLAAEARQRVQAGATDTDREECV